MGKFLKRRINTVFIMLGNSCNMNCAYCLQHPLVHEPLTKKINPDIYEFLTEIVKEGGPIHLQFYGGEPLLYFNNIREIVLETKKRKIECSYGIISNGRAITDEMVDFINTHGIYTTISWDGYSTELTRGFDVMQNEKIKSRLLKIDTLGLSGVISAFAYPKELLEAFQDISNEYRKIHHYQIRVNLDEIFDTGIANRDLLYVDYERVEREMQEIAVLYLENFLGANKDESYYTKMVYLEGFFQTIRNFYLDKKGEWRSYTASCGNGINVLNMDLDGNLYPCHNTSVKAGHIKDDYFKYLQHILAGDHTHEHRAKCMECPALAFCRGGCKLVSDKAREETYCKLKQAVFVPVLSVFEAYGKEIGDGNGQRND